MITWIPVEKDLPKQIPNFDDDGNEFKSSDVVLIWTTDKDEPIALGCYQDDKWFVNGIANNGETVTHWAFINGPDGHLLKLEYYG